MSVNIDQCSALDTLLYQSLQAITRTEAAQAERSSQLVAVLLLIAGHFCSSSGVVVQSVIEPAAALAQLHGQPLRVPRLLVQCAWRNAGITSPLTLSYTPVSPEGIALQITHGATTHPVTDRIVWNAVCGWHIPAYGPDLDAGTHTRFLRAALVAAGLFTAQTFSLEPLTRES